MSNAVFVSMILLKSSTHRKGLRHKYWEEFSFLTTHVTGFKRQLCGTATFPNQDHVDSISNPWFESAATVGNYLLFISNVGLVIKLSIKGVEWEWRPHPPHRHFTCPHDLHHQQVHLCSEEKLACSALAAGIETISGLMPCRASLFQLGASVLLHYGAAKLRAPTGLTGCCLQVWALVLWFWIPENGSIGFGGLMTIISSISSCIKCFKWRYGYLTVQSQTFHWKIGSGLSSCVSPSFC